MLTLARGLNGPFSYHSLSIGFFLLHTPFTLLPLDFYICIGQFPLPRVFPTTPHPSSHLWVYRWVQWDLPQRGQAWSLGMTWAWHACSQFSMTLYFYHLSLDKISYHGSLFVFRLIGIVIQHNSRVFSFF